MLRHLVGSFCFSLSLLLAACGGGSGSSSSSSSGGGSASGTAVSSNVVKGIIRNGVIKVSRWQNGAYAEVASTLTDAAGGYTLDVPDAVAGEVLRIDLALSTDVAHPTQMLCDADHCGAAAFGDWVTLTTAPGLSSWISVSASSELKVMPMTPVSTLLVRYAEGLGGGHLDTASVAMALERIAALFGMDPASLLATPGNVASAPWVAAASTDALKLSLISAAFAQLAADNSKDVSAILDDYAGSFVGNNGRLMQDGDTVSLANLYAGIKKVIVWSGAPASQAWVDGEIASLKSGLLNPVPSGTGTFDSGVFVDALGTTTDSLGGDIRRVMQEKGATTLEQLLAGQLSQFAWLTSPDTVAIAGVAVQSLMYAVLASADLDFPIFPLTPNNGLTPTLDNTAKTLHITGTQNGLDVDLTISLTRLLGTMQAAVANTGKPVFNFGIVGTISNANINASINGTLKIDATGTNFSPLVNSISAAVLNMLQSKTPDIKAVTAAIGGILRTGKATFTLTGNAAANSLVETGSSLAIDGSASLTVDMAGGSNGAIAASGAVDHGTVTLPNGAHFGVDKAAGDFLTFALGQDGTFTTKFGANVLSHDAVVTANGTLAALGPLLSNLRDSIASQLENASLNLDGMLTQLLADAGNLALTVNGQANIADFGHVYKLSLAKGELIITQPNSDVAALDITISKNGLLTRAGSQWWLVGLHFTDLAHPVLSIADASGNEWQWAYDFSGLLVAPPPV